MKTTKMRFVTFGFFLTILSWTGLASSQAACFGALPFNSPGGAGGAFNYSYVYSQDPTVGKNLVDASNKSQGPTYRANENGQFVTDMEASRIGPAANGTNFAYAVGGFSISIDNVGNNGNGASAFTMRVYKKDGSYQDIGSAANDYGFAVVRRGTEDTFDIYKINGNTGVSVRWDGKTMPTSYQSYQHFPVSFVYYKSVANVDNTKMVKAYFSTAPSPMGGEGLIPTNLFLTDIGGTISASKAYSKKGDAVQVTWNAYDVYY